MDIHDNFEKKMSYISMFNGVSLNMEEKLKLDISLKELHKVTEAEEVLFWGKIIGTKNDYYIALLVNYKGNYEFPKKAFYYAVSTTWVFTPLPGISKYHIEDNENFHFNQFSGEPGEIVKQYIDPDAVDDNLEKKEDDKPQNPDPLDISDSEDNKVVVEEKKNNFTELDKLAFTIRTIDFETSIFPQGGIKLIPIHELRRNDNFKGLKAEELTNINKYSHFRKLTQNEKIVNIEKDEAIFRFDILDDLNKGSYKSTWSFQLDSTKKIVNIRSLLWPGYFSFHKAETNLYGGIYIGEGIKNAEMPFMI